LLLGIASATKGQTLVSGPISGTWTPAGNPYIAVDNCTVPAGQTLTIQPGVIFLIGSNLTVTANGSLIQAVGTPGQRITIKAAGSVFWNTISLVNAPGLNQFHYCDFVSAQTAISMGVYGVNQTMPTEILNCTFSNCVSQAIYGEAQGGEACCWYYYQAWLNPVIKNCVFSSTGNGCVIKAWGQSVGYGNANPEINGNVFKNLSGTAFMLTIANNSVGGQPLFINNTVINCQGGVSTTDPFDVREQDNIFIGVTNAVTVSGSLSRAVSYNDFYNNATNFTGYPGTYGTVIWVNRNGTPADVLFNIFQHPLFAGANDFHLTTNSPCIDAGTPDGAFTDMCFPPSLGTSFPDLGAYGGPDACNSLDVVPVLLPTVTSFSVSGSSYLLSWGAVPRSSYQILYSLAGPGSPSGPGSNDWQNLPNGQVVAADKPTSLAVWPYPSTNSKAFFSIQPLGRTPGN
jgi:hypothetical protein